MPDQPLRNLQRWMQSVITHPGGVVSALAAPSAEALDLAADGAEQIIEPSSRQSSVERLSVYADAYYARLIECLQAEFPIFRQTVGDDAFADFAIDYLHRYPSQSYTLSQLGDRFVAYLTETKPPQTDAADWADFAIDLARLERTISEVFDGPGCEEKPPLRSDDLLAIDPERWPHALLVAAPCLRLLSLQFPLNDYYTAMKANQEPIIPARSESWLAITRRDYIVRRYELSRPQFILLDELQRGQTVGHAIQSAAAAYEDNVEQFAADLRNWFRQWAAAPMFENAISS
jgi:Putative DNA-binding domain